MNSGQMDISKRMRELLSEMKGGHFRGRIIPLSPECEEEWTADYAICVGMYVEDKIGDDEPYCRFDIEGFMADFESAIRDYFGGDVMICINFRHAAQELEVYRRQEKKEVQ